MMDLEESKIQCSQLMDTNKQLGEANAALQEQLRLLEIELAEAKAIGKSLAELKEQKKALSEDMAQSIEQLDAEHKQYEDELVLVRNCDMLLKFCLFECFWSTKKYVNTCDNTILTKTVYTSRFELLGGEENFTHQTLYMNSNNAGEGKMRKTRGTLGDAPGRKWVY